LPTRPERDSSPFNVRTPVQADVTCEYTLEKSASGVPASEGRAIGLGTGAQEDRTTPNVQLPTPKQNARSDFLWKLGVGGSALITSTCLEASSGRPGACVRWRTSQSPVRRL
jgi:hypothetical protein